MVFSERMCVLHSLQTGPHKHLGAGWDLEEDVLYWLGVSC